MEQLANAVSNVFTVGRIQQLGVAIALNVLFAPRTHTEGPRLEDLRVTTSNYGAAIPYIMGTERVSGSIVWASNKRVIAHTTDSGKGGGSSSTTYTYEVDLLFMLAENPCNSIVRVFMNNKLIWTSSAAATTSSVLASDTAAWWKRFSLYEGYSSQLPDPTYEAALGVGNAPAYRGRATCFFEGFQLDGSGQIPNMTFEIAQKTTETSPTSVVTTFVGLTGIEINEGGNGVVFASDEVMYRYNAYRYNGYPNMYSQLRVERSDTSGAVVRIFDFQLPHSVQTYSWQFDSIHVNSSGGNPKLFSRGEVGFNTVQGGTQRYWITDLVTGVTYEAFRFVSGTADGNDISPSISWVAHDHITNDYVVVSRDSAYGDQRRTQGTIFYNYPIYADGLRTEVLPSTCGAVAFYDGVIYMTYDDGLNSYVRRYTSTGVFSSQTEAMPYRINIATAVIKASAKGLYVWDAADTTDLVLKLGDNGKWCVLLKLSGLSSRVIGALRDCYVTDTYMHYVKSYLSNNTVDTRIFLLAAPLTVTVSAVVTELCVRAGMAASQIDVTDLASITVPFKGFKLSQVASTRSALEILGMAYSFDWRISDKLVFKRRGQAPSVTVPFVDLGAGKDEYKTDTLVVTTANDLEIPAQTAVTFLDPENDYNENTQYSDKLFYAQGSVNQIQVPVVLSATDGKKVADALHEEIVSAIYTSKLELPRFKYFKYQPGDTAYIVDKSGRTYTVRIVRVSLEGPIVVWDVLLENSSAFTQAGVTTTSGGSTQTVVTALPPTTLVVSDIPMLRDADSDYGVYLSASGGSGWNGAAVYSARDNVNFVGVDSYTTNAVQGGTSSVLGNWTAGYVFDETNTVNVWVNSGTLASTTQDDLLLSESTNRVRIGNEILQFATATLISTSQYTLSRLLRGLYGTERHIGTHTTGEPFVALSIGAVKRHKAEYADLQRLRFYRGVTLGLSLANTTSVENTPAFESSKCYSPVDLRANRDSTDTILTWKRRTRSSATFCGTAGISVPLGELSEAYELEVWNSGFTVLTRLVTGLSLATFTYTNAMQVTDWGSGQSTLYLRVYQVNTPMGRGNVLQATV